MLVPASVQASGLGLGIHGGLTKLWCLPAISFQAGSWRRETCKKEALDWELRLLLIFVGKAVAKV